MLASCKENIVKMFIEKSVIFRTLAQETELKKQIDEEKARSQEIDDMEAYVGTDEYVEEIAKEKLGLVNENEIILKAK